MNVIESWKPGDRRRGIFVRLRRTLSASARSSRRATRFRGPGRDGRQAARYPPRVATKEEKLEMEGEVMEAFPNGMFKIKLDAGQEVLGYTAGKMRRFRIKIFPGDRVKIELSPYDLTKGRIVYRFK
jgi:translation initiation factor IF-1